jgi:AhpD family alkylhydroperoxidase
MSRIAPLPYEQWDPELKAMFGEAGPSESAKVTTGVLAHAPKMLKAMMAFQAATKQAAQLSPRLRELVRLRVAFHNQCRTCMAMRYQAALDDGLTEGEVCSLEKPEEAPNLTPREKAALAYADVAATNHFAINDETFAKLREHFTDSEIIELGIHVASCIGFGRLGASLYMVEILPEEYSDSGKVAPWTHAPALVPA